MIKEIYDRDKLLALIISSKYKPEKTTFVTDNNQLLLANNNRRLLINGD